MKSFIGLRILLVFLMFFASTCILTAQEWEALGAKSDAEADANADVNKCCWFGSGFVFHFIAVGVAIATTPSPDPSRFIGKSPEYVRAYANAYKSKAKNIRLTSAFAGCASLVALVGCVMISIAASDASENACDLGCSPYPTCTLGDEESCGGCGTSESGGCGSDGCNSGGGK
ncbi:hypothetical protein KAW18_10480 [candidate division WOR-3 bacterium]|nr:hypothetical protein [candidate division WOR-3 bacterium]